MSREDIQKLLGGYATGTLTTAEEQALFEAALEDQELFDQLAREQAMRDLLRDPSAKAQVLRALDQPRRGWFDQARSWWPAAATAAVACAALLVLFSVRRQPHQVVTVANGSPQDIQQPPAPPPTAPPAVVTQPPAATPTPRAKQLESAPEREAASAAKTAAPKPAIRDERRDAFAKLEPPAEKEKTEKEKKDANAPAATLSLDGAVQPAAPAPGSGLRETVQVTASAAPINSINVNERDQTVTINEQPPQTAQALFYNNAPVVMPFKSADQAAGAGQNQAQPQGPQQTQQQPAPAQQKVLEAQVRELQFAAQQSRAKFRQQMVFPGVKYRILRRLPTGDFAEANVGDLKSADTVKVELTINVSGKLTVTAGRRPLLAQQVIAPRTYTTEPLDPGTSKVTVDFIPQDLPPVSVTRTAASGQATNVVEHKPDGTYVVGVLPARPVHFTIELKYR